jgi:hypothetical protein
VPRRSAVPSNLGKLGDSVARREKTRRSTREDQEQFRRGANKAAIGWMGSDTSWRTEYLSKDVSRCLDYRAYRGVECPLALVLTHKVTTGCIRVSENVY